MTPILILTVGLPRSGKSTWAKAQGVPVVSPDAIRLALHGKHFLREAEPWVWTFARTMAAALFLAGHETVIVDATNTTVKRRGEWYDPRWQLRYKVLGTSSIDCVERALANGDEYIVPIIERQSAQYEPLTEFESQFQVDIASVRQSPTEKSSDAVPGTTMFHRPECAIAQWVYHSTKGPMPLCTCGAVARVELIDSSAEGSQA